MALYPPGFLDAMRAAFGDRLWLTGPDRRHFVLQDRTGLALVHDRAFTLEVADITTPVLAWERSYGLFVAPLNRHGGSSEIRVTGTIACNAEFGVVMSTDRGHMTLWNTGLIEGRTAVNASASSTGILTLVNGGEMRGEGAIWAMAEVVHVQNQLGGRICANEYPAITLTAQSSTVTNDGVIQGLGQGAAIEGRTGWLTLTNTGAIIGRDAALDLTFLDGAQIRNEGLIAGDVLGSMGMDVLYNTGLMDHVATGAGDDVLRNTGRIGSLDLGTGHDLFDAMPPGAASGTQGLVRGGRGDDTLSGGSGDDLFHGGDGRDSLLGRDGADRLWGGEEADRLQGGAGADRLWGGNGFDTLLGQSGDDRLHGGESPDWLFGGEGDDWLEGGAGGDALTGGAGADVFVLDPMAGGRDRIRDFTPGEDHFLLTAPVIWIEQNAFSGRPGELRWHGQAGWFEVDLDGDRRPDWAADVPMPGHRPSAQDFL